jgi:hypothetical protein
MTRCSNCFAEFHNEKDTEIPICRECERLWVNEIGPKVFRDDELDKDMNDPI